MTKKSLFLGLLLSTVLVSSVFSQEFILVAMSGGATPINIRGQETHTTNDAAQSTVMLDRSGINKASVHLQIFQQTAGHLTDTVQAKKSITEDKKLLIKILGNS